MGVKVIIIYDDQVLFIQHSYGLKTWTFPGGGIKKWESPEHAAKREAREEVGIKLDSVTQKGSFLYNGEHKRDTIFVFLAEVSTDSFKIDNFEIQNACWENINSLTLPRSPITQKCLEIAGYKIPVS
jgi:8-oxo-dGTP pyrophosphatase MutT (NUDIX family)